MSSRFAERITFSCAFNCIRNRQQQRVLLVRGKQREFRRRRAGAQHFLLRGHARKQSSPSCFLPAEGNMFRFFAPCPARFHADAVHSRIATCTPASLAIFAARNFEIMPPRPSVLLPLHCASSAGVSFRTTRCSFGFLRPLGIRNPSTLVSSSSQSAFTAVASSALNSSLSPNAPSSSRTHTLSFSFTIGTTPSRSNSASAFCKLR